MKLSLKRDWNGPDNMLAGQLSNSLVLWYDETRIYVSGSDGVMYVRQQPDKD